MATIKTSIMVLDNMSPALRSMSNACRILLNDFEDMRKSTANTVDTQNLKLARAELNNTDMILNQVEQSLKNVNDESKKIPNNFNNATIASDGLLSKVKQVAIAVGGLTLAKKMVELSDESVNIRARLDMMNDGLQTTAELQNQIFAAADRSRGSYLALSNTVASLGNQAKSAFSSSSEIVGFGELLNKMFTISGLDSTGIESTMYNLTQSLSSGKLLGNDYRILKQNAPQMIQYIQDFYKVSRAELDDMVSKGEITAEGIKQAMFVAANDINAKFDTMPMTWSQVWNRIQNITIKALDPVLIKINELANNERVQSMVNMFVDGISIAAQAILILIEGISWLIDVLEPVAPLILGIVAAYVAFNVIAGITSSIISIMSIMEGIHAASTMLSTGATLQATAAQWGLNAALLASPITWIILSIIILIALLFTVIAVINDVTGTSISAIGIITGTLNVAIAFVKNLFLGFAELVFAIIEWFYNGWAQFANFFANVFVDPVGSLIHLFGDFGDRVLGVIQKIAEAIDFVFGTNLASTVSAWRDNLKSLVDIAVEKYGNGAYEEIMPKLDIDAWLSDVGVTLGRSSYTDAWNTGYDWGANLFSFDNSLKDLMNPNLYNFDALNNNSTLGDIANNTGKIANNTEISSEDLKYLLDIAERETINRFTTASVNINMTNNNNVNSEQDIDGMVEQLAAKLEEELQAVADGVHE
ncbi:MAG: tape measure protein [Clostridia bacterium]|nr:tape measure protein [Clostridia bacterium]